MKFQWTLCNRMQCVIADYSIVLAWWDKPKSRSSLMLWDFSSNRIPWLPRFNGLYGRKVQSVHWQEWGGNQRAALLVASPTWHDHRHERCHYHTTFTKQYKCPRCGAMNIATKDGPSIDWWAQLFICFSGVDRLICPCTSRGCESRFQIASGTIPQEKVHQERKGNSGTSQFLCEGNSSVNNKHWPYLRPIIHDLIGETDEVSITSGFFPVGNPKAVESSWGSTTTIKMRNGEGRSLVSPLMINLVCIVQNTKIRGPMLYYLPYRTSINDLKHDGGRADISQYHDGILNKKSY